MLGLDELSKAASLGPREPVVELLELGGVIALNLRMFLYKSCQVVHKLLLLVTARIKHAPLLGELNAQVCEDGEFVGIEDEEGF